MRALASELDIALIVASPRRRRSHGTVVTLCPASSLGPNLCGRVPERLLLRRLVSRALGERRARAVACSGRSNLRSQKDRPPGFVL